MPPAHKKGSTVAEKHILFALILVIMSSCKYHKKKKSAALKNLELLLSIKVVFSGKLSFPA